MKVEILLLLGKLDPGLRESETLLDIRTVFRDAQDRYQVLGLEFWRFQFLRVEKWIKSCLTFRHFVVPISCT